MDFPTNAGVDPIAVGHGECHAMIALLSSAHEFLVSVSRVELSYYAPSDLGSRLIDTDILTETGSRVELLLEHEIELLMAA